MAFAPQSHDDFPMLNAPAGVDTRAILTAAGEVAYEWTVAADTLVVDGNAAEVLGVSAERLASGRAFATFLDPRSAGSRNELVLSSKANDPGDGVRYEVVYAFLPEGPRGRRLMIEDELKSGALVTLLDITMPTENAYYVVRPENKQSHPAADQFQNWLLSEVSPTLS